MFSWCLIRVVDALELHVFQGDRFASANLACKSKCITAFCGPFSVIIFVMASVFSKRKVRAARSHYRKRG